MKPAYNNYIAGLSAKEAASARKNYGVDVMTDGGKKLRMMTRPLKGAEGDLVPQNAINAAASDLRLFNASPSDFPTLPAPETILTWDGNSYTVIFAVNSEMSGLPISTKIYAYRTPQADSAGDETPAEAAQANAPALAGERRVYAPPASTL